MKLSSIAATLCCCAGLPLICGAESGVVNANSLNARLRPELKSPVMHRLVKGDKVEITGKEGEFYRIAVPENAPVYISAVYISGSRTLKPLNMRCQDSSSAASYGILPKDSEVKVLKVDLNGWAKIAPPAGLQIYAANFYIDAVPGEDKTGEVKEGEKTTDAAKTEPKEAVKPAEEAKAEPKEAAKPADEAKAEPKEAVKPADEVAKPVIDDQRLKELKALGVDPSSGSEATVSGLLVPLKGSAVPGVGYALLDAGRKLLTFVSVSDQTVGALAGQNVTVSGVSFKVPTWKNPVLAATKLEAVKP
ncbi:MAG: SH3 domain-containing protein [Victivallaceae bacterium]|nr:SH3 domain-containing protein [Victivallaceae bacterium]